MEAGALANYLSVPFKLMARVNCMTQFAVSLEAVSTVTGVPNVEVAKRKCINYSKEK